MSRRLKKLLIVLAVIVIVAGVGVGGYFLLTNLSKTTVSDLKIIDSNGVKINDTSVYLQSSDNNKFNIRVSVDSTGSGSVYFRSSDDKVATVVRDGNSYAVEYYKAGSTVITAYSSATTNVKDSFTLHVYEDFVTNIVIDEKTDNVLTAYGDGNKQVYNYVATGVTADVKCNNELIRIVDNYDKNVFNSITINQDKSTITFDTKQVKEDSVQTLVLQSYYIDEFGTEHVSKNFFYTVNVIGYRIKDMQMIVSQNYQFENSFIYLSADDSSKTSGEDPFLEDGEVLINNIYLTDKIKTAFFKIRVIYSNGDSIPYSGSISSGAGSKNYVKTAKVNSNGMNYLISVNADAVATLDETDSDFIEITFTDEKDNQATRAFEITYLVESDDAGSTYQEFINKSLYVKCVDKDTHEFLYYEYIYWDSRYCRLDTVVNSNGQVIDFVGADPDCETKEI